eukprot:3170657-Ditylum_brightwellii.AAC.1
MGNVLGGNIGFYKGLPISGDIFSCMVVGTGGVAAVWKIAANSLSAASCLSPTYRLGSVMSRLSPVPHLWLYLWTMLQ